MNWNYIAQLKSNSYVVLVPIVRTAICAVAALSFLPVACAFADNTVVAEALFEIGAVEPAIAPQSAPFNASEYKLFQNTQLALVKCPYVLNIAIRDPGAMTNSLIASEREPSGWLAKHIEVEFIGESSVMVIRLRGTEDHAEQVKQLVDAVCSAYQNEVVFANDQERLVVRDALAATVGHLKETLESEMTEQKALAAKSEKDEPAAKTLQLSIEANSELWRRLFLQLGEINVEAAAPMRIKLIQPATIRRE